MTEQLEGLALLKTKLTVDEMFELDKNFGDGVCNEGRLVGTRPYQMITDSMCWADTPQGRRYWHPIYRRLGGVF